jgi:hypothetical protein
MASAPEASRAWLLVEDPGPWPHEPTETALPAPLDAMVAAAATLGIRVQMIRRPGRRTANDGRRVFVGWTAGTGPWLRCGELTAGSAALTELELKELSTGSATPAVRASAPRSLGPWPPGSQGKSGRPPTSAGTGSPPTW